MFLCKSLAGRLISNGVRRSCFGYTTNRTIQRRFIGSSQAAKTVMGVESEEDELMRSFFENLKEQKKSVDDESTNRQEKKHSADDLIAAAGQKDSTFSVLLEFMRQGPPSPADASQGLDYTPEIIDLKAPVHNLARRIDTQMSEATSNFELKLAIDELMKNLMPHEEDDGSLKMASARLLATAFAMCRKRRVPTLAYSLFNYIRSKSDEFYVSWMSAHGLNELVYMEWTIHGDLGRLCILLHEFQRGAVLPNTYTFILLSRIRKDVLKQRLFFSKDDLAVWNQIVKDINDFASNIPTLSIS